MEECFCDGVNMLESDVIEFLDEVLEFLRCFVVDEEFCEHGVEAFEVIEAVGEGKEDTVFGVLEILFADEGWIFEELEQGLREFFDIFCVVDIFCLDVEEGGSTFPGVVGCTDAVGVLCFVDEGFEEGEAFVCKDF